MTYYATVIVFGLGVGIGAALAYLRHWASAYAAFWAGALSEFLAACLKGSLIMAALSVAACLWCGWRCGRHLAWRVR